MKHFILVIAFLLLFYSCNQAQQGADAKNLNHVGSIHPDDSIDDPNFTICDDRWIFEYYNFSKGLQFEGEKIKIIEHFKTKYKPLAKENGYFTVRFVVNCKGQTGRFRTESMDFQYQAIRFDERTTDQLLKLTKELKGWGVGIYEGKEQDYYQYLTFKIEEGQLTEILP